MIYYELKIESSAETIEITEDGAILSAKVEFDTVNKDTQKKSNAILARMTVCGKISAEINDSLIKIFNWAYDLKNETTYRKVTLTVYEDDNGQVLRIYEIPDMFVYDYTEEYKDVEQNNTFLFELKLTQRENRLKEIKTYK